RRQPMPAKNWDPFGWDRPALDCPPRNYPPDRGKCGPLAAAQSGAPPLNFREPRSHVARQLSLRRVVNLAARESPAAIVAHASIAPRWPQNATMKKHRPPVSGGPQGAADRTVERAARQDIVKQDGVGGQAPCHLQGLCGGGRVVRFAPAAFHFVACDPCRLVIVVGDEDH